MNNIQNYGINNFQLKNNAIMFRANTKPIGEALQKTASKSGIYQVYVDKLAELQKEIEYGCYLLRQIPHNWCDPKSASDANRDICIRYHKNVDKLKNEKKKIITEMVDLLLKKEKYKDLPKGYRDRIIDGEEAGSTWQGYYFNEKQLDKRIANMKARDKQILINAEKFVKDSKDIADTKPTKLCIIENPDYTPDESREGIIDILL